MHLYIKQKQQEVVRIWSNRWCVSIERHGLGMTTMRWKESGKPGTQIRWPFVIAFLPIAIPQPVEYQPWAQDRPYDDAPNHNCMLLKVIASLNPPSAVYLSSKYPLSSQTFQVNLEDSGTTLAKTRNPNMEDRECERAHLGCGICEVAAPVRRVNIRGLCDLSIFDRSIHTVKLLSNCTSLTPGSSCALVIRTARCSISSFLQGLQLHHQWRRAANVCWESHFCALLQQILGLMGLVGSQYQIPAKYHMDLVMWTIFNGLWFDLDRYDRKDPSVVAISLSPEGSLLLGVFESLFYIGHSMKIFEVCTVLTSLRYATTNVMLELDSQGWDQFNDQTRSSPNHITVRGEIKLTIKPDHLLIISPAGEVDQVDHLLRGWVHMQWWPVYRHGATVRFLLVFLKVPKNHLPLHCCPSHKSYFSPAATKPPIVLTNQTKTIANCSRWKWEQINLMSFYSLIKG